MSRSIVVAGTPRNTAADIPTTMNSMFASTRSRTSVAVSETRGLDTTEPQESLEHLLREPNTLEWRALERDRDQGSIDVTFRGKAVRIERADHRAKLFERSCRHVHLGIV